jgi:hypothetical protein
MRQVAFELPQPCGRRLQRLARAALLLLQPLGLDAAAFQRGAGGGLGLARGGQVALGLEGADRGGFRLGLGALGGGPRLGVGGARRFQRHRRAGAQQREPLGLGLPHQSG